VVLSNLTDKGAETIVDKPERIKEVNEELSKIGAKVKEQYVLFSDYDFVKENINLVFIET
jgi:Uncharacterized conserved protein